MRIERKISGSPASLAFRAVAPLAFCLVIIIDCQEDLAAGWFLVGWAFAAAERLTLEFCVSISGWSAPVVDDCLAGAALIGYSVLLVLMDQPWGLLVVRLIVVRQLYDLWQRSRGR